MKGIMGRKVGMTQLLTGRGEVVPVTIIEAGPCFVTQIKTAEKDGYTAIQLGFDETKQRRLTKGQVGHLKRRGMPHDVPMVRVLRELRIKNVEDYELGQKVLADIFTTHERVDVIGISKGRGFQGGVKRHGFHGGPRTHGQSDRLRAPAPAAPVRRRAGSTRASAWPGTWATCSVTVANLRVVLVDAERNLLAVRGAVPGARGSVVLVTEARKQGI